MRVYGRLRALLLALVLLAVAAPAASAVVVHSRHGHFYGVLPHRDVSSATLRRSIQGTTTTTTAGRSNLSSHGGAVVHTSAPYLIFWTPSGEAIPDGWQAQLERYFSDVAADSGTGSSVYAVNRQYTDPSGYAAAGESFSSSQVIVDDHAYPSADATTCRDVTSAYPTCLTDTQIQDEVERLVSAEQLPTDGASEAAMPAHAPVYFVVLPSDVNDCLPLNADGTSDCADNSFCAYHSSVTDNGHNVLYVPIPTLPVASGQDLKSCQDDGQSTVQEPNGSPVDVVLKYLSHEDNETLTDPFGDGWYATSSGNEAADSCNDYGRFSPANGTNPDAFLPTLGGDGSAGTLYDQVINSDPYYLQSEWSNGDSNCEMHPTSGTVSPQFAAPSGPDLTGSALSFNPSGSSSSNSLSSATWDWGDGSTSFSASSPLGTVSHTYAGIGTYTVTLTLVDNRGNRASTSQQITVSDGPEAAEFSFSPATATAGQGVQFDASESAPSDRISSYSWSFGDGATAAGVAPNHTYGEAGTYQASLTVAYSDGSTARVSHAVTVEPAPASTSGPTFPPTSPPPTTPASAPTPDEPPSAALSVLTAQPVNGGPVAFTGAGSSDPDGSIVSYRWSFGDGATATGANPTHTYARPGAYSVALTVTDSAGQSATAVRGVTIASAGRITKVVVKPTRGGATVSVTVSTAGALTVGRRVFHLKRASTVKVVITLTRGQLHTVKVKHQLKVRIPLRFAPRVGPTATTSAVITFHPAR